ncbi:MAG: DUF3536 domain-containing protein [Chloroflexi bacterium]|nr:DUF3536 domain-containing protein [Chloroflexota bacterium]
MPSQQSLCVHAHFYQPPREDPISGIIPVEKGAWPYQNWNEKVFDTCYKPNVDLGNFNKISFNIGPTLSNWLEVAHPDTLKKIIQADQSNMEHFGVGNAISQSYNHSILPLANRRDKRTQVIWGIYSFQRTFKRKPQGMWLPETAVDLETLSMLAENGIEFTILAPWQADTTDLDIRQVYQVQLPDHRSIKVFFYHSGISSRISFDPDITQNADRFIHEVLKTEYSGEDTHQMLVVASDGELYGHHQSFRDKFLSHLLNGALSAHHIDPSFPALQLRKQITFPLIKIKENTSWSCHHGIERWKGVCGCSPDGQWKASLRSALDWLSKQLDSILFEVGAGFFPSLWRSRDKFIEVVLGEWEFSDWLESQACGHVSPENAARLHSLLLAQVEKHKMFTSCGWFFDDFDRIEPRNNVIHASYAVWLTKQGSGVDLAPEVSSLLAQVKSPVTGLTADQVFNEALARLN